MLRAASGLYEALSPKEPRRAFDSARQAALAAAEKLNGKKCLLVVDDVWDKSDLSRFLDLRDARSTDAHTPSQFSFVLNRSLVEKTLELVGART